MFLLDGVDYSIALRSPNIRQAADCVKKKAQ